MARHRTEFELRATETVIKREYSLDEAMLSTDSLSMARTTSWESLSGLWVAWGMLAIATGVAWWVRPITPIDETRYVGVAWEMWTHGQWLVPLKNGELYTHKPPLLFWLIHLGWGVWGVNDLWPRLISPLFAAGSLRMLHRLARELWPVDHRLASEAVILLCGISLWLIFATALMFDTMLSFWVLTGIYGLFRLSQADRQGRWWLGGAIGFGILAKGPVVLLYFLPVCLLAPFWLDRGVDRVKLAKSVAIAFLLGLAIPLLWLIPAISLGGNDYAREILWQQSMGRVSQSFAHQRPIWWYLGLLPLILMPISLALRTWRDLVRRGWRTLDQASRFCVIWGLGGVVCFSLISGKQAHYLLPIAPAFVLLWAKHTDRQWPRLPWTLLGTVAIVALGLLLLATGVVSVRAYSAYRPLIWPALVMMGIMVAALWLWWRIPGQRNTALMVATLGVTLTLGSQLALKPVFFALYDVRPIAHQIAVLQASGASVAHAGKYHGQYQFLGRLSEPLVELVGDETTEWLHAHPNGYIVLYDKKVEPKFDQVVISQPYRSGQVMLMSANEALAYLAQRAK